MKPRWFVVSLFRWFVRCINQTESGASKFSAGRCLRTPPFDWRVLSGRRETSWWMGGTAAHLLFWRRPEIFERPGCIGSGERIERL